MNVQCKRKINPPKAAAFTSDFHNTVALVCKFVTQSVGRGKTIIFLRFGRSRCNMKSFWSEFAILGSAPANLVAIIESIGLRWSNALTIRNELHLVIEGA